MVIRKEKELPASLLKKPQEARRGLLVLGLGSCQFTGSTVLSLKCEL